MKAPCSHRRTHDAKDNQEAERTPRDSGRPVDADRTTLAAGQAAWGQRPPASAEAHGAQWDYVRVAYGVPVEDGPPTVQFRQHLPLAVSDLGVGRRVRTNLARVLETLRRSPGDRLALPVDGQCLGIGTSQRGDQTGKDPTNRDCSIITERS